MKPAKHNLTIYQGSTFRQTFTWKTGTRYNMNPVNIGDMQFTMQLRSSHQSDIIILELSTANGKITKTDSINGEFMLYISAEDTAKLDFIKSVYDIEVTYLNNDVFRLFEGSVILKPEVTRDNQLNE